MREWRPIDTAPKDGTPILAFIPDADPEERIYVLRWDKHYAGDGPWLYRWTEAGGEGYQTYAPTHWMPLPAAPEGG